MSAAVHTWSESAVTSARPGLLVPGVVDDERRCWAPYVSMSQMSCRGGDVLGRPDAFHGTMWDGPATARWTDRATLARADRQGQRLSSVERECLRPVDPERFWSASLGARRARAVAALLMWRVLTADQLAEVTGDAVWAGWRDGRFPSAAAALVGADLLRVGMVSRRVGEVSPTLFRVGLGASWDRVARELSYVRWVEVTGGKEFQSVSGLNRHNVLMTEFALRVASWCPGVSGVLGEPFGMLSELVPGVVGSRACADAVLVRRDGFRLAVEMTATTKSKVAEKVDRWARALMLCGDRSVGVLFVSAGRAGSDPGVEAMLRHTVSVAALGTRERREARLGSRMFVGAWRDWFPEQGQVCAEFARLPVHALTKDSTMSDPGWRTLFVADPDSTPWSPRDEGGAVQVADLLTACHTLAGQPHWLCDEGVRQAALVGWEGAALVRAGVDGVVDAVGRRTPVA